MNEMGRILQVVTDTDRRGAQVFATELERALVMKGQDVRTVALTDGDVGGLEVPVLGPQRLHVTTLRRLRDELRRSKVAIAHGSSTLPACAIATVGLRTPFVYRQISDSRFWARTARQRLRVRLGLRRAAIVVALWRGSADTLATEFGVPRTKLSVVPNGVATARFREADDQMRARRRQDFGMAADRTTVLSMGALVSEKGVDLAIDAVAATPDLQLLVVGDGPERPRLEARAQQAAPARVVFSGSIPDPVAAYSAADVVVLPSRGGDSMPAVLIEAGLMGLPCIATPVEGIPEIVLDGVTGELVPIGSLAALKDALGRLTSDPERARSLGRAGRKHCLAEFAIERVADRWLAALSSVLDVTGAP